MRHSNYVVVAGKLTLVPLALDMPIYAVVFLVLYAAAAYLRIQVENSAQPRRQTNTVAIKYHGENESARARRALSLVFSGVQRLALSHAMRGMSDRVMPISASSRSPS
jgi:hypothetical protein